jgi:hypothetical protein
MSMIEVFLTGFKKIIPADKLKDYLAVGWKYTGADPKVESQEVKKPETRIVKSGKIRAKAPQGKL